MQPRLSRLHELGGCAFVLNIVERLPINMGLLPAQLAVLHNDEERTSEVAYCVARAPAESFGSRRFTRHDPTDAFVGPSKTRKLCGSEAEHFRAAPPVTAPNRSQSTGSSARGKAGNHTAARLQNVPCARPRQARKWRSTLRAARSPKSTKGRIGSPSSEHRMVGQTWQSLAAARRRRSGAAGPMTVLRLDPTDHQQPALKYRAPGSLPAWLSRAAGLKCETGGRERPPVSLQPSAAGRHGMYATTQPVAPLLWRMPRCTLLPSSPALEIEPLSSVK